MIAYLLCFNQRSGSSWLTSLLDTAGLGPCKEFLKDSDIDDFNDCLSVKVTYGAVKVLSAQMDLSKCKIIRLNRRDRMRQAISFWRADMTQRWSSFDQNDIPEPEFDREEIMKRKRWLDDYDKKWEEWLEGKQYLEVWYEELLEDSTKVLSRISEYLELPIVGQPETYYVVQRDELTENFYKNLAN